MKEHTTAWTRLAMAGLLLAVGSGIASAQFDDDEPFGGAPKQDAWVREWDKRNAATYADADDVLLLPGLVARRSERRVEIIAERTALRSHEPAEYLLVGTDSSHGYESLFWSHARPLDIHRALEFIGLRAGTPRDPRALRFWSRGPRVLVTVAPKDDPDAPGVVRLEEMILDTRTDTTIEEEGFLFTGSLELGAPTARAEDRQYLADRYEPFSIIPSYNEPASVLDVPWQATKGEIYQYLVLNPAHAGEENSLVTLVFEPEDPDGAVTVRDLALEFSGPSTFQLRDAADGSLLQADATFAELLTTARELVEKGQDLYASVQFDGALTLEEILPTARTLSMLEQLAVLRIEPPQEGRLFYRAFLPDPAWREASGRLTQPWELHLRDGEEGPVGTMVIHEQVWHEGQTRPELTPRRFEVPNPEAVPTRMSQYAEERAGPSHRLPPDVLLVFAPGDMTHAALLEFLGPVLQTVNTVHLFLPPTEPPATPAAPGPAP